eukprot:COSAG04_NODE_10475_length_774_cov_1.365926_1_plen_36_part_10
MQGSISVKLNAGDAVSATASTSTSTSTAACDAFVTR